MSMSLHERGRIGVVVHLSSSEYPHITECWKFELPQRYESSLEALIECRYVAFTVDGRLRSVAAIESWAFEVGENTRRLAKFSSISESISSLYYELASNLTTTLWLTQSQAEAIQAGLDISNRKDRPEILDPCLDFEEASLAVARRYGVVPEQVRISIHRKTSASESE